MMKIGLLSLHKNTNYGWVLQCYALLSILKSLGHDVTYIDKVDFVEKKKKVIIKSNSCISYCIFIKKESK